MSNIQQVTVDYVRLRSYAYEWGSGIHAMTEECHTDSSTAPIHLYNNVTFDNAEKIDLPTLNMLVSIQMTAVYEKLVVERMLEVQTTNAIIMTAGNIAYDVSECVRTGNASSSYSLNKMYDFMPDYNTKISISAMDFMKNYLHIEDKVTLSPTWGTTTCESALQVLLDQLDSLNRISDDQAINLQSAVNYMTLAENLGVNINKLLLHNARNISRNF